MFRTFLTRWEGRAICLAAFTLSASALAAFAQDGPPPPPFGGGGPGGGGGQRMPFRPMGPPPEVSASTVPLDLLRSGLNLSDDQTAKIQSILESLREDRRALMPRGGGGPGSRDGNGGPPDFEAMKANREKVRTLEKQAAGKVEAVLTGEQNKKLADILKDATLLRDAGLPMEVAPELKLSGEQRTKLKALAPPKPGENGNGGSGNEGMPPPRREQNNAKAMAILTGEQRAIVQNFMHDHPRPPFGGGGGPGGRGGGPGRPGGGFGGGPGGGPGPGGPQVPPPPDGF